MLVKAFITVCMFPLLFLFPADSPAPVEELPGDTTTTGVGFGRPNKNCSGAGICIVTSSFKTGLRDGFGIAKLTMGSKGSVDRIVFLHKSLTEKTLKEHFSGKYFLMEESYEGNIKLGDVKKKILIPAGKYKMNRTREGFLLEVSG